MMTFLKIILPKIQKNGYIIDTTKVREIPTSNLMQLDLKFMGTRFPSSPESGAMMIDEIIVHLGKS